MDTARQFGAPWSKRLKVTTAVGVAILLGMAGAGIFMRPGGDKGWMPAMIGVPLALLAVVACLGVRGYELTGEGLAVRRLLWKTKVPLKGLAAVEVDEQAMAKSVRTWGIGGLFCFAGAFWNEKLGSYCAWATDPKRAVVLRCGKRIVVVTPDDPAGFAAAVEGFKGK